MSNFKRFVAVKPISEILNAIALQPPAWTRLEPQSVTGDPTPGLEARVHDPLWALARQWQFAEFRGEDAGTPLGVTVQTAAQRVTAWQPGDPQDAALVRKLPLHDPLDPFIEREPPSEEGPGLRQRAEAGSALVTALQEAGFAARKALVAACPLPVPNDAPRMFRTIALSSPDGESAASALEAGPVPWLAGAPPAATSAAKTWLAWYRSNVSPRTELAESWIPQRLEYRFSVRVGGGQTQRVFTAPVHEGGAIDWHSFDFDPNRQLNVAGETGGDAVTSRKFTMLASPLQYGGMPSDRLWQFEDGAVNFGKMEVQRFDLARLCFVEFAMIYGSDWFVAPVDVDAGSFVEVTELAYTTTFGDRFVVPAADDNGRTGRFRLFEISLRNADRSLRGFFVPPTARGVLEGRALEEVLFLRDESANMAWAVESIVQGASGDPRSRRDEPQEYDLRLMSPLTDVSRIPTEGKNLIIVADVRNVLHFRIFDLKGKKVVDTDENQFPAKAALSNDLRKQLGKLRPPHELSTSEKEQVITAVTSITGHTLPSPNVAPPPRNPLAELQYRLATTVPRHWIPLVPVRTDGKGGFVLRKGTMTDVDESQGRLLDPTPLNLQEEEVPREGVRVRRIPSLARAQDGRYVRWIARRVSVGRGEGSSGLAFDNAQR